MDLTAVIVPIPAAEPLIGQLRSELDPPARWGVPAHVTVLFPFVAVDDGVLAALGEVVATVPAFTATFAEVGWFGEDVVWLAPRPVAPFVALTVAVQERFELRPYEGKYGTDPVPHLTVGNGAPLPRLRAAAASVVAGLPVHAEINSVRVITGRRSVNSWSTVAELSLGPRADTSS